MPGAAGAHGVGLIHRDVKPSNVMVCERGGQSDVAKLLDFGLVRGPAEEADAAHLTDEQTVIGTPAYLSPEQACGKPTDARSDIYSLGATAYFLLTGQPPFVKPRVMEVIAAHITEQPRPTSECCAGIPADLCAAVMALSGKEPDRTVPGRADAGGGAGGVRLRHRLGRGQGGRVVAPLVGARSVSEGLLYRPR